MGRERTNEVKNICYIALLVPPSQQFYIRLYEVTPEQKDETSATCVDDIMIILKSDYDNAYFVTGNFTFGIYAEDCIFEDPTIKFHGLGKSIHKFEYTTSP